MMLRAQMTAAAVQQAGRALEIDPHVPQAHYVLGEAALTAGDVRQAVAEFQQEIACNPSFFMAYYRLGAAYVQRGAWDAAVSTLELSIWLNPNHSGPYALIGKAYLKRGDLDDATGALRHALQMDPQDHEIRALLDQASAPSRPTAAAPQSPAPSSHRLRPEAPKLRLPIPHTFAAWPVTAATITSRRPKPYNKPCPPYRRTLRSIARLCR